MIPHMLVLQRLVWTTVKLYHNTVFGINTFYCTALKNVILVLDLCTNCHGRSAMAVLHFVQHFIKIYVKKDTASGHFAYSPLSAKNR